MTRIFLEYEPHQEAIEVVLPSETLHYLLRVVRLHTEEKFVAVTPRGQQLTLVMGEGVRGTAQIVSREMVMVLRPEIILYTGLLKGQRWDVLLQKCTELGATRIVPLLTEFTIVKPNDERVERQLERWRKIVLEACRQCGRVDIPVVELPVKLTNGIKDWQASGLPGVIAWETLAGDDTGGLAQQCQTASEKAGLAAFIGPEGGFSAVEVAKATEAGLVAVSLGPLILRAETAAMMACAIIGYEMGWR